MTTFEERARARADWPVRVVRLGDEGATDPRDTTTVDERLRLVAVLTLEQWALSGREIPTYARAEMPGRVVRRGG
jgi:hypothetical protein